MVTTTSLVSVLLAVIQLLFGMTNVTLQGTAEFRLNDERFKGVEARYVQDSGDSFWQLKLYTPRMDGTERETGYTIICNENADWEANIYVMSAYEPGVYRSMIEDHAQPTLVTPTVKMMQLADLALALTPVFEAALPEGAVTVTEGENGGSALRLVLREEDITPLMNAAFNNIALPVTEHVFRTERGLSYDTLWGPPAGMDAYTTVTDGLLWSARSLNLRGADITVTMDAEGLITAAKGSLIIDVETETDGTLGLAIDFDGTMSDYGTSHVDAFDAEAFGVVPASD